MKKILLIIISIFLFGFITWVMFIGWIYLRGVRPAISNPPYDISTVIPAATKPKPQPTAPKPNTETIPTPPADLTPQTYILNDVPLRLPKNFTIAILANNLGTVRDLQIDAQGNLWASRLKEGVITKFTLEDGVVIEQTNVLSNLNLPHGLAFDPAEPELLYIAEETKISRLNTAELNPELEVLQTIPAGGRHKTRALLFGEDGRLYISIGSSCDTCEEPDPHHASVYSMNKDGSDFKLYAQGLRNAVFMTKHPTTDEIWVSEMGRDFLGDDLPPDEINILQGNAHYGWPFCYGKQTHDKKFNQTNETASFCTQTIASTINLPAHSAPLGITFHSFAQNNQSNWPTQLQSNLFLAYHGSWNRSQPTGYKIVYFDVDAEGNVISEQGHDFITGWLANDSSALGRPVDLEFYEDYLFISDDHAGVIYRVTYTPTTR